MPLNKIKGTLTRRLRRIRHPGTVPSFQEYHSEAKKPGHLRLLSFNIQVGINTQQYRHYLTKSWQHVLPHARRIKTLDRIATAISDFDLVALQEVDGGSLRSGFVNQTEYLALRAGFPLWYQQLNRNLGKLAQHSNGLLSRYRPSSLEDHKLPGLVPGRGAIIARFGNEEESLAVVMMHLALSQRARNLQLSYLKDVIDEYDHVVLMGDMNAHAEQLLNDSPLRNSGLVAVHAGMHTFPSWRPRKSLDHILVSSSIEVQQVGILNLPVSDHLPVAVDIKVPEAVNLFD